MIIQPEIEESIKSPYQIGKDFLQLPLLAHFSDICFAPRFVQAHTVLVFLRG